MIILDTNIISEIMKPTPAANVISWINQQQATQLFITTITIAEIVYGLNTMPQGKRRSLLEDAFNKAIAAAFKHRILAFEETSAHLYGTIMSRRKALGRPLNILDGQIAAMALAYKAIVATRNTKDFTDCNLELLNPFDHH
ncbi:type II toxin-antitoxin system VapC family toxin [soil metagenome]